MPELTVGATIGPFTIIESMAAGHGGMARVFIAAVNKQTAANEQAFYFEALNNEVEILKRLRHPNVVRLFPIPRGLPRNPYAARATEIAAHPWFCVMEFLGGG